MSLQHVHFEVTPIASEVTGNEILANYDETRLAVLPTFTYERLQSARDVWARHVEEQLAERGLGRNLSKLKLRPDLVKHIEAIFTAREPMACAEAMDHVLCYDTKKGGADRIAELLVILWKHHLVALPAGDLFKPRVVRKGFSFPDTAGGLYGPLGPTLTAMRESMALQRDTHRPVRLFLAFGGLREVGDISEAALQPLAGMTDDTILRQGMYETADRLLDLQRDTYKNSHGWVKLPQSYRPVLAPKAGPGRSDPEFWWAVQEDPERAEPWRSRVTAYVADAANRYALGTQLSHMNAILDYVIIEPSVPAEPLDYCRRSYVPTRSFLDFLREERNIEKTERPTVQAARRFFNWLLDREAVDPQTNERSKAWVNPIPEYQIPSGEAGKGQTDREALPPRFVRLLMQIIREDDYRWPKTLKTDWFKWWNPAAQEFETVWSPVRAYFYLFRLILPLRQFQVRLLDSGEGDEEVFRRTGADSSGAWVRNEGIWAPRPGERRAPHGLIRRIREPSGETINGLYITTNKTADRSRGISDQGYVVPWQYEPIIDLYCSLRDWQEKYNPVSAPLTRAELSGSMNVVSDDLRPRLPKLFFLFRDAASTKPSEPPSDRRLSGFWLALLDELEQRLNRQRAKKRAAPIEIITSRTERDRPVRARWDRHSLRVTGITNLHAEGVPIEVLSAFVAGHATILMTLYYDKPSPSEISDRLTEASASLMAERAENWKDAVSDADLRILEQIAVCPHPDGLRAILETRDQLAWSTWDSGVCPNGGTLCDEGGPRVSAKRYGPVPGGRYNCARCRFFATGLPFLQGLVARANATAWELTEARDRAFDLNRRYAESVADLERAAPERARRLEARVDRMQMEVDKAQAHFVERFETYMAWNALIGRVLKAGQAPDARTTGKNLLVLTGNEADFRVSLESASEFELADRICQDSVFFPSSDASIPAVKRRHVLEAMSQRNGLPLLDAIMPDHLMVELGNAQVNWLRTLLGPDGRSELNALVSGETTLDALGIKEEFRAFVEESTMTIIEGERLLDAIPQRDVLALPAGVGAMEGA